jgi:hypothetical protein
MRCHWKLGWTTSRLWLFLTQVPKNINPHVNDATIKQYEHNPTKNGKRRMTEFEHFVSHEQNRVAKVHVMWSLVSLDNVPLRR